MSATITGLAIGTWQPRCMASKCTIPAKWRIRYDSPRQRHGVQRVIRCNSVRCEVHGREWAERNGLTFPPSSPRVAP
jgi:hypothetical protein